MKTEITDCIWGINVGHWTFRGYCVFEEFEDSVARDCWPAGAVAENELDSSSASLSANWKGTRVQAIAITHVKNDNGLGQSSKPGDREKWLESGYIFKAEPREFSAVLGVRNGTNKWVKEDIKFLI